MHSDDDDDEYETVEKYVQHKYLSQHKNNNEFEENIKFMTLPYIIKMHDVDSLHQYFFFVFMYAPINMVINVPFSRFYVYFICVTFCLCLFHDFFFPSNFCYC